MANHMMTRAENKRANASLTPRLTCHCGHIHEGVEQDGITSVFHRCRAEGCPCNEFRYAEEFVDRWGHRFSCIARSDHTWQRIDWPSRGTAETETSNG